MRPATSRRPRPMTLARLARLVGALVLLPAAMRAAAPIPPFTIDTVLAGLRRTHPEATRVSDALPAGVVAHENLVYARRGDATLALDVYRPAGDAILPAVIIIHGGGWVAGDRTMERPFAQHLAARGYVAVTVSYRLGVAGRFPAPVLDLKRAVRWLRAHAAAYGIDPAHIAAAGGSAGGTLAAMLGATNGDAAFTEGEAAPSSDVQAVVDIDGTVTFLDNRLIAQSMSGPSPYWEYVHGPYDQARATWVAASPIIYVSRRSAPTLFINSTVTQPILVGRAAMARRLGLLGIDSATVVVPGTPHPFWLVHPWFDQVVAAADRFLRRQFK